MPTSPQEQWPPLFYRVLSNRVRDWQRRRTVRQRVMAWLLPAGKERGEEPMSTFPDPAGKRPEELVALSGAMDALDAAIIKLAPRQTGSFVAAHGRRIECRRYGNCDGLLARAVSRHIILVQCMNCGTCWEITGHEFSF